MNKILLFLFILLVFAGCSNDVKDFDGNSYKTVKIGNQVWMAENLKVHTAKGSWCYANKSENCEKYGRLYTWVTAMALPDSCYDHKCEFLEKYPHQGLCPVGFHVPSTEEFYKLYDYVGKETEALKFRSKESRTKEEIAGSEERSGEKNHGFGLLLGGVIFNVNEASDNMGNGTEGCATGLWTRNNEGVTDTTAAWLVKLTQGIEEDLEERFNMAKMQIFYCRLKEVLQLYVSKDGGGYIRCVKD